jgi:hypothetical protein
MSEEPNKPVTKSAASRLMGFFSNNIVSILGSGVVAILLFVFWTTWESYKVKLKDFIIETTALELAAENNRLVPAITKTIQALRKSEVGSLVAGNFVLTPSNPSYTLYIYFPDGYSGKLHYKISGVIIPNRRYVALVTAKELVPISNIQDWYDLSKLTKEAPTSQASLNDELFKDDSRNFLKGLRAITFQLQGPDSDLIQQASPIESTVGISYVSFIAPAIHMGQ